MQNDHYNYKTKMNGLSVQTVNARLRFSKTFYSFLEDENLIKDNSIDKIKLLKSDERKFTKLTDDELKRLFEIPNKENFPQFWDFVILLDYLRDISREYPGLSFRKQRTIAADFGVEEPDTIGVRLKKTGVFRYR